MRWLQRRGLVLNTAAHHKAVTGAHIESLVAADYFQMAGDYVDNLLMGMTVPRPHPALLHPVLSQKQLVIVGADNTSKTRFGRRTPGLREIHNSKVFRLRLDSFHSQPPDQFPVITAAGLSASRARRTAATNCAARSRMPAVSPEPRAFGETSSPPTATATEPARMNSSTLVRFTPPVGTSGIWGRGPFSALMYPAPPTLAQGKTFTMPAPAFHAAITSVGVSAPAIISLS